MDEILNPTIFLGNFEWREPITTLTDQLVAIVALIGFLKFKSYSGIKSTSYPFFKYYFLCFAIGMTSAAWLGHGLQAYVGPEFKRIGWVCGASGLLFFGLGSFVETKSQLAHTLYIVLKSIFIGQYILFVVLMLYPATSNFIYAQLSSTVSLIAFILPLHVLNYYKTKSIGSGYISLTIGYSILPGWVYNNQVSFSRWFNYHDISHVLMTIFMIFMILSTSKLSLLGKRS
jgi:hypothetical protein